LIILVGITIATLFGDNATRLENEKWTEDLYQKNFDNMVRR